MTAPSTRAPPNLPRPLDRTTSTKLPRSNRPLPTPSARHVPIPKTRERLILFSSLVIFIVEDRVLPPGSRVGVKAEPELASRTAGVLKGFETVSVTDAKGDWVAIQKPLAGWVAAAALMSYATLTKIVAAKQMTGELEAK